MIAATNPSDTPVSQTHARSEICVGTGLPRSSSRGASWKANFAWGLRGDCAGAVRYRVFKKTPPVFERIANNKFCRKENPASPRNPHAKLAF